jgi:hypothetical protein
MPRLAAALCLSLVLLAAGCGGGRESQASRLERFLVANHVTPAGVDCVKGDDGYDYVCTYRSRGRLWKQGFLLRGGRPVSGTSAVLITDHLSAGPRPEPQRRAHLLRLLGEICSRNPRRWSRDQEAEVVRLEPLVPARMLVDFTAFAGAFHYVVDQRQAYRDAVRYSAPRSAIQDAAMRERAAHAQLRVNARRLGFDCG